MLVSKPTHGGGSPLGIDLEAGVAKITVRRPAAEAEPADQPDETGAAEQEQQAGDRPEDAPA